VTRYVCEKFAQNVAQPVFLLKLIHRFYRGTKKLHNLGFFCNFQKTVQSKQSPNSRKFAQSGHPVYVHEGPLAVKQSPPCLCSTINNSISVEAEELFCFQSRKYECHFFRRREFQLWPKHCKKSTTSVPTVTPVQGDQNWANFRHSGNF
jgi:hypothetical protein